MDELVFATNNLHKLRELQQMLANQFKLLGLADIGCMDDIPEESPTIEENSLDKAKYVFEEFGKNCFADDTGLEIEALDGRPGVISARYAGENKDMDKNIEKVLAELQGQTNRKARFKTIISLILDGNIFQFEGLVYGKIIDKKRGNGGFGYDPVFVPDGYDSTFAEMEPSLKNTISHRGIAVAKLVAFLTSPQKSLD
jgi:XTP/dITP diphosphohydrolase